MKKSIFYLIIILSVLFIMGILSLKNGKIGITNIMAYTTACGAGPNLVSGMDAVYPPCPYPPPIMSAGDVNYWVAFAPSGTPVPSLGVENIVATAGNYHPNEAFGVNYLKVTWTVDIDSKSMQKIYYDWPYYENVGSDPGNTTDAKNWSDYGYIRFYMYCNEFNNDFGSSVNLSQTATLYDGSLSKTVGPVQFVSQWNEAINPQGFIFHCTSSLNFIANSYDRTNTWNAGYFNISNVVRFSIDAPGANYSDLRNGQVYLYYDFLTLGAKDAVPSYGMVTGGSVKTARGAKPVEGANIQWNLPPLPTITPAMPVTGFHVYRSENYSGVSVSGHPYYSVGIYANNVTNVVDTACPGGNTYCYKVMILNNGPNNVVPTEVANTINGTYHESLLDDVGEICGWVDVVPSATPTPTSTWDTSITPPTATSTPTVTPIVGFADAHVYPNPFNPMAGSKTFYVNNVQPGTKVTIFAMDGALVKVLETEGIAGRFAWDGRNNNGTRVVSGLYYLVLEFEGATEVKRVIVCYKCDPVYHP